VASVWTFKGDKKPSKTPSSVVCLAEADDVSMSSQCLFDARLSAPNTLRIAAGSQNRPWFETLSLVDAESGEAIPEIEVPRRVGGGTLSGENKTVNKARKAAGGDSGEVAVVGSSEMALPSGRDEAATRGKKKRVEISMGEMANDASMVMEDASAAPKADSSAVLLTQALKNEDNALLEDCLSCRDHSLITNTVRRLPVTSILPFLKQVSNRVRSKPGRASTLVFWIRAVLTEHTAYLTSVPAAGAVLAELFQAADTRLGVFDRFLKLQGRLDLVMAHVSNRGSSREGDVGTGGTFVHREAGIDDDSEEEDSDEDEAGGMELDLDDDEDSDDEGMLDDDDADMDDYDDDDL